MTEAVIVSTARTGIGKAYRGALNNTHGAVLAGHVIKHAVERASHRLGAADVIDVTAADATDGTAADATEGTAADESR